MAECAVRTELSVAVTTMRCGCRDIVPSSHAVHVRDGGYIAQIAGGSGRYDGVASQERARSTRRTFSGVACRTDFHRRCLSRFVPFRNFCDKMVTSFLPSFLSLILRQRRVNEMGTQQLLLDVYNLKTLMLKVPSIGTWRWEGVRMTCISLTATHKVLLFVSHIAALHTSSQLIYDIRLSRTSCINSLRRAIEYGLKYFKLGVRNSSFSDCAYVTASRWVSTSAFTSEGGTRVCRGIRPRSVEHHLGDVRVCPF